MALTWILFEIRSSLTEKCVRRNTIFSSTFSGDSICVLKVLIRLEQIITTEVGGEGRFSIEKGAPNSLLTAIASNILSSNSRRRENDNHCRSLIASSEWA